MRKVTHQHRLILQPDGQIIDSPRGRLFVDSRPGDFTDLSDVRVLRCGVDTVRQLYNGLIRPEVKALFDSQEAIVEFAGHQWSKGRIGRDSGYQFRLQNADLGLILLIIGICTICAFLLPSKLWLIILGCLMVFCGFKLFNC